MRPDKSNAGHSRFAQEEGTRAVDARQAQIDSSILNAENSKVDSDAMSLLSGTHADKASDTGCCQSNVNFGLTKQFRSIRTGE